MVEFESVAVAVGGEPAVAKTVAVDSEVGSGMPNGIFFIGRNKNFSITCIAKTFSSVKEVLCGLLKLSS